MFRWGKSRPFRHLLNSRGLENVREIMSVLLLTSRPKRQAFQDDNARTKTATSRSAEPPCSASPLRRTRTAMRCAEFDPAQRSRSHSRREVLNPPWFGVGIDGPSAIHKNVPCAPALTRRDAVFVLVREARSTQAASSASYLLIHSTWARLAKIDIQRAVGGSAALVKSRKGAIPNDNDLVLDVAQPRHRSMTPDFSGSIERGRTRPWSEPQVT